MMIFTDYLPSLLYFLLSYSKDMSQNIDGGWVQNMVSRFSNSSPKGSTGWWLNWLTKVTEHYGSSWNSITEVPEGSLRFENVCWCFIVNPKGPSASWMFSRMTRSLYSVLYKYEALELKCSTYTLFRYYMPICSVIFIILITQADCFILVQPYSFI